MCNLLIDKFPQMCYNNNVIKRDYKIRKGGFNMKMTVSIFDNRSGEMEYIKITPEQLRLLRFLEDKGYFDDDVCITYDAEVEITDLSK